MIQRYFVAIKILAPGETQTRTSCPPSGNTLRHYIRRGSYATGETTRRLEWLAADISMEPAKLFSFFFQFLKSNHQFNWASTKYLEAVQHLININLSICITVSFIFGIQIASDELRILLLFIVRKLDV